MQSVVGDGGAPLCGEVAAPTMSQGAEAWSALCGALDDLGRLQARIVGLAGTVAASGTIEAIEGLTLDQVLGLTHRLPQADRSMLLTAAEVLGDMPATAKLFADGVLSWGQVRGIVAEARRLTRHQRGALDGCVDASAELLAKLDPDAAVDAVRVEAMDLRGDGAVERSERTAARGNFVWAQPGLFARGRVYGEYDNVSLAAIVRGMDDAAGPDDGRSQAKRRADGLLALALHRCDEHPDGCGDAACTTCAPDEPSADADDAASPGADDAASADAAGITDVASRPQVGCRGLRRLTPRADIDVIVDWRDVTTGVAGRLLLDSPGCVPTVSAALLESLAATATIGAVISHGARPLATTRKIWARSIPADIRRAVRARDRRDRFPGSRRPIDHLHHRDKTGHGHDPDTLMGLSRPSHTRVHRHGWTTTLDPATGEITFTRGQRSWTTAPAGTRLRRPPPR